jgi:hypothetical protein
VHLIQRAVLVLTLLGLPTLQPAQPGEERHPRRTADAQRQHVDEGTGRHLNARQIGRATGNGDAEYYVALAALAAEQERPRSLHEGVRRQSIVTSLRPQRCAGLGELALLEPLPFTARGNVTGPVLAQRRRGAEAGERAPPEGLGLCAVLAAQPFEIGAERIARAEVVGSALRQRTIELDELFDE